VFKRSSFKREAQSNGPVYSIVKSEHTAEHELKAVQVQGQVLATLQTVSFLCPVDDKPSSHAPSFLILV
jgi:hypothetical protein